MASEPADSVQLQLPRPLAQQLMKLSSRDTFAAHVLGQALATAASPTAATEQQSETTGAEPCLKNF
jgi:hypothetical protein